MKKMKKIMALVLAMVMVLAMALPAMAAEPATAPTKGSITVNSPIIGAQYFGYKVFDLSMDDNANPTAFSYTIKTDSPFYKAVQSYAAEKETLTLTAAQSDPTTVNVTVPAGKTLDAQDFGKYLRDRLATDYTGEDKIPVAEENIYKPSYASGTEVTVADAAAITFNNLPFGYYLITNNYDDPAGRTTVTLKVDDEHKWELTAESTTAEIEAAAQAYAQAKYPDSDAAKAYVESHASQFEKKWDEMDDTEKAKVLTDLQTSTKADAIAQVNNARAAAASDDNAQEITERFVFIDTTKPDATINEKNEIHKWDVPVNPDGSADLPDIPDHDEPEGGKNIIVGQTTDGKTVYGDTTETNIGDVVHYQLSINAVNYERNSAGNVQQIKDYVIADYQNKNMEFVPGKKLMVTIVKKDKDGNIVGDPLATMDYTSWVTEGYFFTNTSKSDLGSGQVFNGTGGIVIPWIKEITETEAATSSNVTTRTVDKVVNGVTQYQKGTAPIRAGTEADTWVDAEGHSVDAEGYLLDDQGHPIPETETKYFASIYPNDVTILVDYYMTLTDTATIDGAGNVNYSQYGVDYFTPTDVSYTPDKPDTPPENPKEPSEKKEKDEATVFTYAIAIKKVDDENNPLAGAKFKLRGVTAVEKSAGWYKVSAYDHNSTDFGTELVTDDKGVLVVEGLPAKWAIEVQETEAPAGFNKLTETKFIQPVKTGSEMTTRSKVTYTDEEGNVTESTTTTTVYKNASDAVVAVKEKIGDQVKYYSDEAKTQEIDETTFNNLVARYTTADETDVTAPANIAELEIVNQKGTELPSTGGMGTTIFYVIGAILVIGGGIVLITRRRMSAR